MQQEGLFQFNTSQPKMSALFVLSTLQWRAIVVTGTMRRKAAGKDLGSFSADSTIHSDYDCCSEFLLFLYCFLYCFLLVLLHTRYSILKNVFVLELGPLSFMALDLFLGKEGVQDLAALLIGEG